MKADDLVQEFYNINKIEDCEIKQTRYVRNRRFRLTDVLIAFAEEYYTRKANKVKTSDESEVCEHNNLGDEIIECVVCQDCGEFV